MIYGTRSNPLSFFLTRSLNRTLSGNNVYCIDTNVTKGQNRHESVRDRYSCNELPVLEDQAHLEQIVSENKITDVIDMTNTSCKDEDDHDKIQGLPEDIKLFTPIFTTPIDNR